MKYIIGLLVCWLSLDLYNFQTKNSIFRKVYNQTIFNLRLSSEFNKISYKKVFQIVNKCLATCSFEEVCHLVQFNKSEQSCSFYAAIEENSIKTTIDDNCIIYIKKGFIFWKKIFELFKN